jgi:hypothetical protein
MTELTHQKLLSIGKTNLENVALNILIIYINQQKERKEMGMLRSTKQQKATNSKGENIKKERDDEK